MSPKLPKPRAPKLPGKSRFPWLGGKTMEPRVRGAGKAKRMKQLQTSSYAPIRIADLKR